MATELSVPRSCSVCVDLTIYLPTAPTAVAVRSAWNIYRSFCPPNHLCWVKTTNMYLWDENVDLKQEDALEPYLNGQDQRCDHGVMVRSDQVEGGWSFTIRGVFPDDLGVERCASFCRIVFPVEVSPEIVFKIALKMADSLDFLSGHGGYSTDFDSGREGTAFDHIYSWSRRYHGIDVSDLRKTLPCMLDGIKGAGWLTLVSNEFWAQLKKESEQEPTFKQPITISTANYGVVIRAGDRPILGDRNRCEFPSAYAEVEKFLQDLKVKYHPGFPGKFQDKAVTMAWLRRLIEPENW